MSVKAGTAKVPKSAELGIVQAIGRASKPGDFPLLERAVRSLGMMTRGTHEWETPRNRTWLNLAQIFRTPFSMSHTALATVPYRGRAFEDFSEEMLRKHLAAIEFALLEGRLHEETRYSIDEDGELFSYKVQMMGGAKFYLGREPEAGDTLNLLVLRDTAFLDRTTIADDSTKAEWFSEISLLVSPGEKN